MIVAEQELIFRRVCKEDLGALSALYASSFKDAAPRLPFEEGIVNEEDSYCAVLQGQIVALVTANPVSYKGQKGHQIFKLCTHSAFRGRGIAGALLSFMQEDRRKKGELFCFNLYIILHLKERREILIFKEKCGTIKTKIKTLYNVIGIICFIGVFVKIIR